MPIKVLLAALTAEAIAIGGGLAAEFTVRPTTFGPGWMFAASLVIAAIITRCVLNVELQVTVARNHHEAALAGAAPVGLRPAAGAKNEPNIPPDGPSPLGRLDKAARDAQQAHELEVARIRHGDRQ